MCDFDEFFLVFGVFRVFLGLSIGLWNPVESVCSPVSAFYLDFCIISFLSLSESFLALSLLFIAFIAFDKFAAVCFNLKNPENTKIFQFVKFFLAFLN